MKELVEKINIDEEFEKILPTTPRKSLFGDSEDYEGLREYIIAQPYNSLPKRKLPFVDVELIDYVDFRRNDAVDKATEEHKHLFFIKQSEKGKDEYCDAAGYYQKHSKKIVLIQYSYIVTQAYGHVPFPLQRKGNKNIDGGNRYIIHSITFNSPEEAATFVLGQKAGLDEWVDRRGKGLLDYYPNLLDNPEQSVSNILAPQLDITVSPVSERHIFTIFVKGICKASGYFDSEKGHFFILKDSLLALNVEREYEKSASGMARNRMIAAACTRIDSFYKVSKDTKCRSASAAASYVLGKDSSYVEWEDVDGKGLKDFFPERFYRKKESAALPMSLFPEDTYISNEDVIHFFYIQKNGEPSRACKASGYFDEKTKTFILKEGSKWASDVTKGYQFTASEFLRRNHIKRNCKVIDGSIIQLRDILCESP
ncbi:DUF4357 domain-containing protein [Bacteroides pyogenes]|uniref:DUF4357 domain-containing protein n=1 Tax=Bacteroides pyogenes TaxID=310300 RepID=UPI001BA9DBAA|nr:DUF4357 domain-containing protein [Bacteroides pyogenes]MBR8705635.1 hypothetical protein [Bacteroides pyogenes]